MLPGLSGLREPHIPKLDIGVEDLLSSDTWDEPRLTRPTRRAHSPGGSTHLHQRALGPRTRSNDLVLASFDSDSSVNNAHVPNGPRAATYKSKRTTEDLIDNKRDKDRANLKRSTSKGKVAGLPLDSVSVSSSLSSSSDDEAKKSTKNSTQKRTRDKKVIKQLPNRIRPQTAKPRQLPNKKVDSRSESDSGKKPTPQEPGKKQAEGALNFFNDSGTQINFWGVSPDEIVERLNGKAAKVIKDAAAAGRQGTRTGMAARGTPVLPSSGEREDGTVDDELDQFFITQPRKPVQVSHRESILNQPFIRILGATDRLID